MTGDVRVCGRMQRDGADAETVWRDEKEPLVKGRDGRFWLRVGNVDSRCTSPNRVVEMRVCGGESEERLQK